VQIKGETQQRQVTETIKRYAKINRNDTVTIQNVLTVKLKK
jgi:hypothetical protein